MGVLSTDAMHISMTHRHADNNMPVMVIDNPLRNIQMNFGLSLFKIALGICTNRLSGEARKMPVYEHPDKAAGKFIGYVQDVLKDREVGCCL